MKISIINSILVLFAALLPVIFVSGCTTGPLVIDAASLLANADDNHGKPVALQGKVSMLGEVLCTCFELSSGGNSVRVWYDTMIEDDGTEWPAVSVDHISNGDEVIVTGKLQKGGTHASPNDFWALTIIKAVDTNQPITGLPNPAAVYCEEHGGEIVMIETGLGTAGYCKLDDGSICEEWDYFNSKGVTCTPPDDDGKIEGGYYCTDMDRQADVCTLEYAPVCGWFDPEKVQCATYPCASTFSNKCFACQDATVLYATEGQCPVDDEGCDGLCIDQGWQVGHCMWPEEICEDDVDISLECYVEGSRHCGNRNQCFCYCKNETKAGDITSFEECVNAGYPVMESYPRKCATAFGETFVEEIDETADALLSIEEAKQIAINSSCLENGTLGDGYAYNQFTKTWWFDLEIEKPGCSPACVVDETTETAEINWRCTGLLLASVKKT